MVSTHLKNISQIGNLPQVGVKKNIWNHHLVLLHLLRQQHLSQLNLQTAHLTLDHAGQPTPLTYLHKEGLMIRAS